MNDKNVQGEGLGYLPFKVIFAEDDPRGRQGANDKLGRILGSGTYSVTIKNYDRTDYYSVSGGDDFRDCWGPHLSQKPKATHEKFSVFGIVLSYDDRGRVFDESSKYIGDLSCVFSRDSAHGAHRPAVLNGTYKRCGESLSNIPTYTLK